MTPDELIAAKVAFALTGELYAGQRVLAWSFSDRKMITTTILRIDSKGNPVIRGNKWGKPYAINKTEVKPL